MTTASSCVKSFSALNPAPAPGIKWRTLGCLFSSMLRFYSQFIFKFYDFRKIGFGREKWASALFLAYSILEPRVNRVNFHWIIDILDQSIPLGMHCLEILSSNSYIRRSSVKAKNSKISKSIWKARFWIRPRSKRAITFFRIFH